MACGWSHPMLLAADEFEEKISDIDRSGLPAGFFGLVDGHLAMDPEPEATDWDDDRRTMIVDRVRACVQRGGSILGAFNLNPGPHQIMVGVAVLDGEPMGKGMDSMDLALLAVGTRLRDVYVERGSTQFDLVESDIEATLYAKMLAEAKARGARKLYVSAASNLGAHVAIEGMTQPRAAPSHSALNGLG